MSFRTQRMWPRASLSGRCCSRPCCRFHIFPFNSLTFGIDSMNRSYYKTSHQTQMNLSDAYVAFFTVIGYLIYLSVRRINSTSGLPFVLPAYQLANALCDLGPHHRRILQLFGRCRHYPLDGAEVFEQIPGHRRPDARNGRYQIFLLLL